MQCFVYRSSIKDGLYIYLADKNRLDTLPAAVAKQLGAPELALSFELTEDTTLSIENPQDVLQNLQTQGFHLQMPQDIEPLLRALADSDKGT